MLVLGIETTCDETAVAVVKDGYKILSNVIHSQIPLHRAYGGVFPEMASRSHVEILPIIIQEALQEADVQIQDLDLISVAKGPGLIGPLLIGLNAAKALALGLKKPFVGVNHVEAHLYAAMMEQTKAPLLFPSLGVVVSGGHTFLVLIKDKRTYERIGSTVDDAIGESFDKVAKLLDLPYPGGPEIEKIAKQGNPSAHIFKAAVVKDRPFDFSFSGLKTNVFYSVYGQNGKKTGPCPLTMQEKADIAIAFQETALNDVVDKSLKAAKAYGCLSMYIGGGVSQNSRLKALFTEKNANLPLFFPGKNLCLDNGAMIAGLAFHIYNQQGPDSFDLQPETRIPL